MSWFLLELRRKADCQMSKRKNRLTQFAEKLSPGWRIAGRIWFGTTVLNFVSFAAIASLLGGDALNGHARDGHYYLVSHNAAIEVSKTVYDYSWWHAVASISQLAVTLAAAGILNLALILRDAYSRGGKA
jgi:hypothetical protein